MVGTYAITAIVCNIITGSCNLELIPDHIEGRDNCRLTAMESVEVFMRDNPDYLAKAFCTEATES